MKHLLAAELKNWSQTSENSNGLLPLLLKRLILNAVGINNIDEIDFPGRRSVTIKEGFDGTLKIKKDFLWFKKDITYRFEFGQNIDTKIKFFSDFEKRTKELNNNATKEEFVFVSTAWQSVNKIKAIEDARKKYDPQRLWNKVIIIDADDIEMMLDRDFATTAWLLNEMGKPHMYFDGADYFWDKWISSTKYPLDEKIILTRNDFNDNKGKITSWLFSPIDILYISSEGYKESILYFIATIKETPLEKNFKDSILQKICIIHNEEIWKEITQTQSSSNLILIPSFGIPEDLSFLQQNNMKIIIPFDAKNGKTLYLERLNILKIKQILADQGCYDLRSFNGTSLLSLQRELLSEAMDLPNWLKMEKDRLILLKLAIVGKWNRYSKKDTLFISDLCDLLYPEIERFAKRLCFEQEAPIEEKNGSYEIVGQKLIIKNITTFFSIDEIREIVQKILSVFEKYDEKFDLSSENRFYESIQKSTYSEDLRIGISKGLAYLSNNGQKETVSEEMSKILGKDWKSMASLEPYISILAEAAPEKFLKWFEDCLNIDQENPLLDLYRNTVKDHPFFIGSTSYTGFLFGLEKLAWKRQYFKRVVYILLKWTALTKNEKTAIFNSPEESLKKLFRVYLPQTELKYNEIYTLLENLKKQQENYYVLFDVLYPLIPTNRSEILDTSEKPLYMEPVQNNTASNREMSLYANSLFEYVVYISEYQPERWKKLLSHTDCLYERNLLKKIKEIDFSSLPNVFKTTLRFELKRKKEWWEKYGEKNRDIFIQDYSDTIAIIPNTNDISEYIYTFSTAPIASKFDEKIPEMQKALDEINQFFGTDGIIELSEAKDINIYSIANQSSLFFLSNEKKLIELLNKALSANSPTSFIDILVRQISFKYGHSWLNDIDFKSSKEDKIEKMLLEIYPSIEFWKWLDENGFSKKYWKNIRSVFLKSQDEYDFAYAKLSEESNYTPLLPLFIQKNSPFKVKNEEKINTLLKIKDVPSNIFYISSIIDDLKKNPEIPIETLAFFDIKFINYIEKGNEERGVPSTLKKYLQDNPMFFVELINILFKPDDKDREDNINIFDNNLKDMIKYLYIPLSKTFLFTNAEQMFPWINTVFDELSKIGKKIGGEIMIGKILSNAPEDPEDGVWPIKYVREYIENQASETVIQQILCEKSSWSASGAVGEPCQELIEIGKKYGTDAGMLEINYPKISNILKTLERHFIDMGKRFGDL